MAMAAYLGQGVIEIPGVKADVSGHSWKTRSTASCISPLARQRSQARTHGPADDKPMRELLSTSVPTVPVGEVDRVRMVAATAIQRWWLGVRDKRIFKLLKEAICAAEHSLTAELLRKVSPAEAELLRDPVIQARIKFRFGGDDFPPCILFKIYTSTSNMGGIQYISGKKMIRPASEAAGDAIRQMGNRRFYDQMLLDACRHHQLRVTDEVDVTTMKEYMQYVADIDESPAYVGGKDNTWRKLNMDVLPRHSFLYNIVDFLTRAQQVPGGVSLGHLHALTRPPSQADQIEFIKTVSSMRLTSPRKRPPLSGQEDRIPSRRSRLAQDRVDRMRRAYGLTSDHGTVDKDRGSVEGLEVSEHSTHPTGQSPTERGCEEDGGEEWERAASELYQWTQELSFEDIT